MYWLREAPLGNATIVGGNVKATEKLAGFFERYQLIVLV
jgi:hypothetical protein